MFHSFNYFLLTILCALLCCSCTVGSNYIQPVISVPEHFKEAKNLWKTAAPNDTLNRGEWWKIFKDPQLNELEEELNLSNQTILIAYENYQQSKALIDKARANFFPNLLGSFAVIQQKQSIGPIPLVNTTAPNGIATGTIATSSSINNSNIMIQPMLNATWETDIWGAVRSNVNAQVANTQSLSALLAATQLSTQATLAQYYFELRGLDIDQKILNDSVINYQRALKLVRSQYHFGTVSKADIALAQSQLQTSEAQAIHNEIIRGQYEHAIAVLIGIPPAMFSLPMRSSPIKIPVISLIVPSALLERRPDIAQAERLMAKANAEIGVATAAYYPTLTLLGTAGGSVNSFSNLFSLPNLAWSLGPQMALTLLDFGAHHAVVRAAKANYLASVAAYKNTILTAFQEVEDNLIALRILQTESLVRKKAADSAQLALKLVTNQYQAGLVSYGEVITAQNSAFIAEKNAVDINYLRLVATVKLIKSLGGSNRA